MLVNYSQPIINTRVSCYLLTRIEKLHINGVALLGRGTDDEMISENRSLLSTWPKLEHKTK